MKPFLAALFVAASFGALVARSQEAAGTAGQEVKHIQTTLPDTGYSVRFAALSISRDWNDSVVHLSGNVQVEMSARAKPASHQVMVLSADTVEFNEKTGEIIPYGNVRLTVRDIK